MQRIAFEIVSSGASMSSRWRWASSAGSEAYEAKRWPDGKAPGGEEATWGAIYARYQRWCGDQTPPMTALTLKAFGDQFGAACERVKFPPRSLAANSTASAFRLLRRRLTIWV